MLMTLTFWGFDENRTLFEYGSSLVRYTPRCVSCIDAPMYIPIHTPNAIRANNNRRIPYLYTAVIECESHNTNMVGVEE